EDLASFVSLAAATSLVSFAAGASRVGLGCCGCASCVGLGCGGCASCVGLAGVVGCGVSGAPGTVKTLLHRGHLIRPPRGTGVFTRMAQPGQTYLGRVDMIAVPGLVRG